MGGSHFVIQQRHFLFRWWWVDAWCNSLDGACCVDSFATLDEVKKNLCRFDGSKTTEEVVAYAESCDPTQEGS